MTLTTMDDREIGYAKLHRIKQLIDERIYFIKCENFVRISRSAQTAKWVLNGMQPFCPFELSVITYVPGGLKLQMALEKTFCRYQHNSLWFRYEGEFKDWLDKQNSMSN